MQVDAAALVRWGARTIGVAVAVPFLFKLVRETMAIAADGGLSALPATMYFTLSLVWTAALALVAALRWPYLGGCVALAVSIGSVLVLVGAGHSVPPDVALIGAAGMLYVFDGSLQASIRSQTAAYS